MFWLRDKKKYYLITCSSTPVLQYDPVRMLYPAVAVASVFVVLLCRDLKLYHAFKPAGGLDCCPF